MVRARPHEILEQHYLVVAELEGIAEKEYPRAYRLLKHGRDRDDLSDSCDGIPGEADTGENVLDGLDNEVVAV
jgi:hypothetical protein